jgi:5,10-methylenetetrahydrofolate reductase
LTVSEAAQLVDYRQFVSGGIWLPERHRNKVDEHHRMAEKVKAGVTFFTSQVIFSADLAIWAIRDYDELCKATGDKPARLILTFAPFGR